MTTRPPLAMAALLLPLALYALFPATLFRGDGMSYASFLTSGSPELLNPNHLLYGVMAWAVYGPLKAVDAQADPMVVLQWLAFIQALICLALFHRLLGQMAVRPPARVGFTLCLAGSAGFWLQAISPETFLLSMILDLIFFIQAARLLERPGRGAAIRLGAAAGLALLGNQVAALLAPAGALVVWRARKQGRTGDLLASGAAALGIAATGFGAAALVARPERPIEWLAGRAWTSSFIAFSPDFLVGDLRNLAVNLLPKLSRVGSLLTGGDRSPTTLLHAALVASAILLLAALLWRSRRGWSSLSGPHRTLLAALAIYLGGLTLFFSVWANELAEFWANHWLLLWLALALASREALQQGRAVRLVPSALGMILVVLGCLFVGIPLNRSEEGRLARRLSETVPRQDLLVVAWNEAMPERTAAAGASARGLARSTFAVNLATYLNRPVVHAGCWQSAGQPRCFESLPGEALRDAAREARDAGHDVWLFQASPALPAAGLAQPGALRELSGGAAAREAWRVERGETFAGARLLRPGR